MSVCVCFVIEFSLKMNDKRDLEFIKLKALPEQGREMGCGVSKRGGAIRPSLIKTLSSDLSKLPPYRIYPISLFPLFKVMSANLCLECWEINLLFVWLAVNIIMKVRSPKKPLFLLLLLKLLSPANTRLSFSLPPLSFFQGHPLIKTVFPIRIFKMLGATTLIVTNAAGGLNPSFSVGDIMVISDHISFAGLGGQNALIGKNMEEFGPRFPPVSDAYDTDLRVLVFKSAHAIGMPFDGIREGTYSFVAGPSFETRAEARFLRMAGGDAVG